MITAQQISVTYQKTILIKVLQLTTHNNSSVLKVLTKNIQTNYETAVRINLRKKNYN